MATSYRLLAVFVPAKDLADPIAVPDQWEPFAVVPHGENVAVVLRQPIPGPGEIGKPEIGEPLPEQPLPRQD